MDPCVFVIDDIEDVRTSTAALVTSMSMKAKTFASAEEFLEFVRDDHRGCVVTDLRLGPGIQGTALQCRLEEREILLPVILVTAFADTPVVVRAMAQGAVIVLDKPFRHDELINAIHAGFELDQKRYRERVERDQVRRYIDGLSESEFKVMIRVLLGRPNKAMAKELDVATRTIEARRGKVFAKMNVPNANVAELVRRVMQADHPLVDRHMAEVEGRRVERRKTIRRSELFAARV